MADTGTQSNQPPATVGQATGTNYGGIPGDSPLGAIITIAGTLFGDLNTAITAAGSANFGAMIHGFMQHMGKWETLLGGWGQGIYQTMADLSVGNFYREMLELGMGIDTGKFDALAHKGVETTDRMLGFAAILPYIIGAINIPGKIIFGGRWPEEGLEALNRIPEEMGLSWVLGTIIEQGFEAAVGESVLEGIREQSRSSRLDWPIIRTLVRQRAIGHSDFLDLMRKQGFPETQIHMIENLDRTVMPIGQLQQLWLMGELDRAGFREQLRLLGYPEQDVNWLTTLNIDKAATASGALLRSTARSLAAQQLISTDQYQSILESVHTPEREVKDDVAAVQLEIEHGHIQTSITNVRNLYLRGHLTAQQAQHELRQMGYSDQAVSDTLAAWDAGPAPRPLSMAKILSYYISGVLTEADARQRLSASGVMPKDVDIIIAHAHDVPRVRPHALTPALVTQAYLDGAIDYSGLAPAYERAGATGDVQQYYIDSAVFRRSRQKRPAGATVPLTAPQIEDAWSFGLMDIHQALSELEMIGYSGDDAMTLLSIKNKGPISLAPPPKPDFASLQDAIAYLRANGYTVNAPIDPLIQEAEGIVWSHGYSVIPPATTAPGAPQLGGGGRGAQQQ